MFEFNYFYFIQFYLFILDRGTINVVAAGRQIPPSFTALLGEESYI